MDFEDARKNTEEMFDDEQASLFDESSQETQNGTDQEAAAQQTAQAVAAAEQDMQQEQVLSDAVNTAEAAAQAAQQKDIQLNQMEQQLQASQQQIQQLRETVTELSNQNEKNLTEELLTEPVLDVNALAFADEETARAAQAEYARSMAEYAKQQIMKEMQPFVDQAKEGMRLKERNEVLDALDQVSELKGIKEMVPQIEKIIKSNKALSSDDIPMDEKYITAYMIAKGVNAINEPQRQTPTVEQLMNIYENNPDFQEAVEKKRLSQLNNSNSQQVPPFSASSGAVNAALNIKEKPKTFEEASERTRRMFGA